MPKVITVGEILVEVMAKNIGQEFTSPGELLGPFPSGAPAIFIDQVARMGVDCGIVARVGEDDFGSMNIERLERDGVDTRKILRTPGHTTGTAFVTYFENGSRKFIFHFTDSAAGLLTPEDIEEEYIKTAQYLHIMGCSLSASDSMREAILKAVKIAKAEGAKVSFDPNIRPELLGDRKVKAVFNDVLSSTDILLTGESEIKSLTGNSDIESTVLELKKEGITKIILKNGSKGVKVYDEDVKFVLPPFKVNEIDPTGAGDCFDGAFIASIAEGSDIKNATLIASGAGALSVTKKGPMEGASFKKDIMEFINSFEI